MDSLVGDQILPLTEAFPALKTFVRPLRRMDHLVHDKSRLMLKRLPAFAAHMTLSSCVANNADATSHDIFHFLNGDTPELHCLLPVRPIGVIAAVIKL